MHETTEKWKYARTHFGVYRRNGVYRSGTTRIEYATPFVRTGIGGGSPSFVCIIEGSGFYYHRNSKKKYPFHPGTLILKEPDCIFDQHHDPGLYIDKYMIFPHKIYEFFMEDSGFPKEMLVVNREIDAGLCQKFDTLVNELRFQSERKLPVTLLRFCAFAAEALLPEYGDRSAYKSEMESAVRLLESENHTKTSIEKIAASVGMSNTNFRRIFHNYFGVSPGEYRIRKKMERVRDLMTANRISVKELAELFGYADSFAFSHQFKQYTGISPRDFYKTIEKQADMTDLSKVR